MPSYGHEQALPVPQRPLGSRRLLGAHAPCTGSSCSGYIPTLSPSNTLTNRVSFHSHLRPRQERFSPPSHPQPPGTGALVATAQHRAAHGVAGGWPLGRHQGPAPVSLQRPHHSGQPHGGDGDSHSRSAQRPQRPPASPEQQFTG